jgi:hypothetical protein
MTTRRLAPGELERAYSRADELRAEVTRKERLAARRIETLARGLAERMECSRARFLHGGTIQ